MLFQFGLFLLFIGEVSKVSPIVGVINLDSEGKFMLRLWSQACRLGCGFYRVKGKG